MRNRNELSGKVGRTWADVFGSLPGYLIVLLLVVIVGMIVRADFSNGITKYGLLGEWGKVPQQLPRADDTIIGANIRLNLQLNCAQSSLNDIPNRILDWKKYMKDTAETYANHSLRQSRTATWEMEVDDVLRQLNAAQQCISGERDSY